MKSESQIKKQLEEIYQHRLVLRLKRKLKKSCKNCKKSNKMWFDLGEFGKFQKHVCSLHDGQINCQFECKYTQQDVEKEMLEDISNPSICGAKEPKIAVLLWILHDENSNIDNHSKNVQNKSLIQKIFGIFKR